MLVASGLEGRKRCLSLITRPAKAFKRRHNGPAARSSNNYQPANVISVDTMKPLTGIRSNRSHLQSTKPSIASRSLLPARTTCSGERHTLPALKEWAPAVAALAAGDQTVLIRKGGIREPVFTARHPFFALFPTTFHTDAGLLKPDMRQRYADTLAFDPRHHSVLSFLHVAEVTGGWATTDASVLEACNDVHIYGEGFLDARLRWRPTQALTILEVRVRRLIEPISIHNDDEFYGCFSWCMLPLSGENAAATEALRTSEAVLSDEAFAIKQAMCREGLSKLGDLERLPIPT
jgi:hypothetical protein